MKKFYITTAIDYVNSKPHLGHAYEKITSDVVARWHRLLGERVFFLTGTDENAQKVYRAAIEAGEEPKKFVDGMVKRFIDLCSKLNISNDDFIRTTEERHVKVAQDIFKKMHEKGDIYKGEYEGLYCYGCEAFYLEKDLKDGKYCPIHGKPAERIKEESYFFRMGKYRKKILDHFNKHKDFVLPVSRRDEVLNRVKEGLKDLSVSRSNVNWGIPVTFDPKHRIYVWKEALENYISALGYPKGERYKKFWPCDYHFIGPDINWFHSVIWPCMLMSLGVEIPKHVFVHGFVNIEGEKMSKSKGMVVDPIELVNKYGADQLRYFLIRDIPFGQDGDFSIKSLVDRVNNELLANYGNLFYRVTSFIKKNFDSVPGPGKIRTPERELKKKNKSVIEEVEKAMEKLDLGRALNSIMDLSGETNRYFQHKKPWEKLKKDREDVKTSLYYSVNVLRTISTLLIPFIPDSASKALKALNVKLDKPDNLKRFGIKLGHKINPEILFRKIEIEEEDPFSRLDLRVAKVLSVKDHPEADKLHVLKIDLGTEKRQIVAGLKGHYKPGELVGKDIIVLANLKKIKLRGVESDGMLLAVEKENKIGLLLCEDKPGSDVFAEGIEKRPVQNLDIKDFLKLGLVSKGGRVYYKDKILKTEKSEIWVGKGLEGKVS